MRNIHKPFNFYLRILVSIVQHLYLYNLGFLVVYATKFGMIPPLLYDGQFNLTAFRKKDIIIEEE